MCAFYWNLEFSHGDHKMAESVGYNAEGHYDILVCKPLTSLSRSLVLFPVIIRNRPLDEHSINVDCSNVFEGIDQVGRPSSNPNHWQWIPADALSVLEPWLSG